MCFLSKLNKKLIVIIAVSLLLIKVVMVGINRHYESISKEFDIVKTQNICDSITVLMVYMYYSQNNMNYFEDGYRNIRENSSQSQNNFAEGTGNNLNDFDRFQIATRAVNKGLKNIDIYQFMNQYVFDEYSFLDDTNNVVIRDPWNNNFILNTMENTVLSSGPDGKVDLSSHNNMVNIDNIVSRYDNITLKF